MKPDERSRENEGDGAQVSRNSRSLRHGNERTIPIMNPNADKLKAPESRAGSKPEAQDDLKSLPMPELQAKLGSSPDGLTQKHDIL